MADKKVIAGSYIKDVTAPQMKEFWSQVALGIANRGNFQQYLESEKLRCLRFAGVASLSRRENPFHPMEHYSNREGLCIDNLDGIFHWHILTATSPIQSVPSTKIAMFDTLLLADLEKISDELPQNYIFEDASMFCAQLENMADVQAHTGNDYLITTRGRSNIFYVRDRHSEVSVVFVVWHTDHRKWLVKVDSLNCGLSWNSGCRVFSASADL